MKTQRLTFKNHEDIELSARLELPIDNYPVAYAIFAHCFTCSKNLNAVSNISRTLTQNGIAVLRFDFTGLGQSQGDFSDTNFSSNVEDIVAAAEFLTSFYQAPSLLIGHSLGGAAVLMAAQHIPSIKAVATVGAPAEPAHVANQFGYQIEEIEDKGIAKVQLAGRPFTVKKQFLDDIRSTKLKTAIHNLGKALLILHSPQDGTVSINNATKIYLAAKHPRSFVSLDGADHLLTKKADSLYVGEVIASWAKRYLDLPKIETLKTREQVVVKTEDTYTTQVKIGDHNFIADEPEKVGGNNFGPNPYELLMASLGACTTMTLRMYANRKKWDLQAITVHLNHEKTYREAAEAASSDAKPVKVDKFERILELEGDLDDKQRARLLEIANRCPVHRTLHGEVDVETKLSE